jgi:hypothetical protein
MAIFIRGPPNSGKSFIANKILEQEKKIGNKRVKFCTPNRFYTNGNFSRDESEKIINNLTSEVIDLLREGYYTFMIVEFEGAKLEAYNQCAEEATTAGFEVFGIDVNQTTEICKKYMKHHRISNDIDEIAKGVSENPVPYSYKCIDPTEIIDPGWTARQPPPKVKTPSPPPKRRYGRFGRRRYSDSDDSDCFV